MHQKIKTDSRFDFIAYTTMIFNRIYSVANQIVASVSESS